MQLVFKKSEYFIAPPFALLLIDFDRVQDSPVAKVLVESVTPAIPGPDEVYVSAR
jgi:hypothetical protein